MNLRRQRHDDPEVNLTSLIDVVFLLLIFFMISTTFEREAQLRIDLPEATAESVSTPLEKLEITIDSSGNYYINDAQVTNNKFTTLKKAMAQVSGGKSDMPVIIRADANARHQAVVSVMDAARQLGLLQISLSTIPGDSAQ